MWYSELWRSAVVRRVSAAQLRHQQERGGAADGEGRPLQPAALIPDEHYPVPSLRAIEQPDGPDVDGPLVLPERDVWNSRVSELLIEFE